MSVQRFFVSVGLVLLVAACMDSVAPRPAVQPTPHFVKWAPATQPQFTAVGAVSGGVLSNGGTRLLLSSIHLDQYTVSFWAVRGESRTVQINYLSASGDSTQPFLRLTTTDPAYVPGVGELAVGDSVLLTVSVDSAKIGVSLEPTGLQFGAPAQLQIWYTGANGDLNGDGVVDSVDATIESQLLGLWYQEGSGTPWAPIPATRSPEDRSFTASLQHFSDYEVSFLDYAISW